MLTESKDDEVPDVSLSHPRLLEPNRLRQLSRSPHPYHRRGPNLSGTSESNQDYEINGELDHSVRGTDTKKEEEHTPEHISPQPRSSNPRTSSDSGTDADDEGGGFLKVLPAPTLRPRKGLRTGESDGTASPLLTPSTLDVDLRKFLAQHSKGTGKPESQSDPSKETKWVREKNTRKKIAEILRRISETSLLGFVGYTVYNGEGVAVALRDWRSGR
jgi:hypothetical protein